MKVFHPPNGPFSVFSQAIQKAGACGLVLFIVTFPVSGQTGTYFRAVTNLNPIGYWPLNETNVPPAAKPPAINQGSLGTLDNGTYSDGAFPGATGAIAGDNDLAAVFSGAFHSAVLAPYDFAYSAVPTFTVETWFNSTGANPPLECVLSCVDANSPRAGWLLYADGNRPGTFNLRLYNLNGTATSLNLDGPIPGGILQPNTWYYIAATFDGTTAKLYINGALAGSGVPSLFNNRRYAPSTFGPFSVGARSDNLFQSSCYQDEVAFFSNVLSAADILGHYQAGTNASPPTPYSTLIRSQNPLLYYRLDDASVLVATNYGSLGSLANGFYESGTMPGAAGPPVVNFGPSSFACSFNTNQANGVGASVIVPGLSGSPAGTLINPVALGAWIQGPLVNWYEFPVSKGFGAFVFQQLVSGIPRFSVGTANAYGTVPVSDGAWHFWFGQWDGTNVSLYIDGQPAGTATGSGTSNTHLPLDIGTDPAQTAANFAGSVCQVVLFTNVLTPAQIQQLYFEAGIFPNIVQQPHDAAINAGQSASFSVTANGSPPVVFQWYRGTPPSGALITEPNAFGATSNTLIFTDAQAFENGNYYVVVPNIYGAVTSAVVRLTVFSSGPATATNYLATGIQTKLATLNGEVLSPGTNLPSITCYYGTSDGGTNTGAWASSVNLGPRLASFSQVVTGLLMNMTYYFTASASNSAGVSWASPSGSFTTLAPTLPALTNLPATGVVPLSAALHGQVLSAGGDIPSVTLFYGPADGGTNAAAWAQNAPLGLQNGAFTHTVLGLASNTTYYFTAQAANAAGTTWAAPSLSFTTPASNLFTVAMLTHHNDNSRTGANLDETTLTVANVNTNSFALLYTRPVDDQIYAQPLVATNVDLGSNGVHNLVLVATVNDSVYAYDADDPSVRTPYWTRSFINPPNIVPPRNTDLSAIGACGGSYQDFSGSFGIVGTPVVAAASGTLYLVARTKETSGGIITFVQRLHALDLGTGAERSNSPVLITATYPGTGSGSVGGVLTFDPERQNQRPGLALVNGIVYISWSSHCDLGPYHGWVLGYNSTNLQQVVVYNDTPNGSNGGIWMSGQAPASDEQGNVYLSTGNGTVDTAGAINRGESFLKLTRSGATFLVTSWFTPQNWPTLEAGDIDLGSGGMLLIPGTNLAFSGGKAGVVHLVNRDNMGGLSAVSGDPNIIQEFQVTPDEVHGGPVWWDAPSGSYAYLWPASVRLQQYQFDRAAGRFMLPAYAMSPTAAPAGQPGGILSLSANGPQSGSGILWAAHQLEGDANQHLRPGILRAYNAENVSQELWNSQQVSTRDAVGTFAKFVPPTVANGKVYLATFSNRLNVYGLRPRIQILFNPQTGQVELIWTSGILQSAGQPGGPFGDVLNASSPFYLSPSAAQQFYRLRLP